MARTQTPCTQVEAQNKYFSAFSQTDLTSLVSSVAGTGYLAFAYCLLNPLTLFATLVDLACHFCYFFLFFRGL